MVSVSSFFSFLFLSDEQLQPSRPGNSRRHSGQKPRNALRDIDLAVISAGLPGKATKYSQINRFGILGGFHIISAPPEVFCNSMVSNMASKALAGESINSRNFKSR